MSVGQRLENALTEFEQKTDGILGSCVILSSQALMMAEASSEYDRSVIQGMSERFMRLSRETLEALIPDPVLQSVTVEAKDHILYIRPVNDEYHVVVMTDKSETAGLREMNIKELIKRLNGVLG